MRSTHFCSRECFYVGIKAGGAADQARKQTCVVRYGVEHPMKDPGSDYRRQRDATCLTRYGSEIPTKSQAVKDKTTSTCLTRFGAPFPMMNEQVKQRMVKSLQRSDLRAAAIKRHETMKRNGSFGHSRIEDKMYQILVEAHGTENIERQKRPEGTTWRIDFYVKSIDTYVQLDGVYWHGLDRPIETIKASATPRDKAIYRRWCLDRKQDAWFAEHNTCLIRITDKQIIQMNDVQSLLDVLQGPPASSQ